MVGVEVGNGLQGDPELGDEGVHEEDIGGDDAVIGGQRSAPSMASRPAATRSVERTWWARKRPSKVVRRASCAALRVGQRLRTSPKIAVSYLGVNAGPVERSL